MAATKLMDDAATRMERAVQKLQEVREGPFTPGVLQEWLSALTDYTLALGELQGYSQQSIHEKLQALERLEHRPAPGGASRGFP